MSVKLESNQRFFVTGMLLSISMLAACFSTVYAQDSPDESERDSDELEEIIVTGSRIRGAATSGAIAVSTHSRDELESFGAASAGELFENLAQAGQVSFNETSDGPNDARGDVASVNMRELGGGNSLLMLNGRRLVAHPTSQAISSTPQTIVNANIIPTASISRVEVLRDGASAIYGADATAGVLNTVLRNDYDGIRISYKYADSEGTGYQYNDINFLGGWNFNNERTRVTFSGSFYDRDGIFASERIYSATVDHRNIAPPEWVEAGNDFRNTSSRSPFGQFEAGRLLPSGVWEGVDVGADTDSSGGFNIEPCDRDSGSDPILPSPGPVPCIEMDSGSLNSALWFDFANFQPNNWDDGGYTLDLEGRNALGRQITPDVRRTNVYSSITHELDNGMEFFGDLLYYDSKSSAQRAAQPLDNNLAFIIVPATNYWNPLGPVTFPDGSLNPNRQENADLPVEGIDVLIERWRPIEHDPRIYSIESDTYRAVAGLRGDMGSWEWESAFTHSDAETTDTSGNRISKTLLAQELAKSTPDAINPFGGPFANSTEQLDRMRIDVTNVYEASLSTWDFRANRNDLFSIAGGDVGAAWGVEWRRETYTENRDARLDGTITFADGLNGNRSDVVGVSPTNDSKGTRNVYSAYGEILAPLISESMGFALAKRLDLQIAVRFESFDDLNEEVVKPKYALSWVPLEGLTLRGTYSEGFSAPNLVQLNAGDITRMNQNDEDFYRCDVTNDADDCGDTYRASIRQGNPDLLPEDTETSVYGFEFRPSFADNIMFGVDWWSFKQENVIDNFGVEEALAIDFLLLERGESNPNVIRAAVTANDIAAFDAWNADNPDDQRAVAGKVLRVLDSYENLDPRTVEGVDYFVTADFDAGRAGLFIFDAEFSKLTKWEQRRETFDVFCQDSGDDIGVPGFNPCGVLDPDQRRRNGKPEWRSSGSLRWVLNDVSASLSFRHISDFIDTSANDLEDEEGNTIPWIVEDWTTYNANFTYMFEDFLGTESTRLRLGVVNLTDEEPPLAPDMSRGYFSSYHNNRGRTWYLEVRASF
jgi:outer membrane receptor protein involved in Fe transport